jgi:dienelactone hydrolase
MRIRTCLVAAVVACAWPFSAHAEQREIDLTAADGTRLKATYFAAGKPGPGVVLLHMCNSERKAWTSLGGTLAKQGIHAIALDYRGYGDSGGIPFADLSQAERQRISQQHWPGDIDAAFEFLVSQPGVDRTRVGAAGGSCGVDNAIQLARRHPEVKTLVLLAGGTNAAGEQFLAQSPWLPTFAAAAHDDGRIVDAMRWLIGFSSGRVNHLQEYPKGGHGTDLFAVHKDLEPAIVAWFDRHLVKAPVRATPVASQPGPSARLAAALRAPGGGARARADLQAARKAKKPFSLAPEGVINAIGYELMRAGRAADAIGLFELNVEAYPGSANTLDSLSDGYLAAGDKVKALDFARKALAALPGDKTASAEFKQQIRESAEGKIRQLGGSSERL